MANGAAHRILTDEGHGAPPHERDAAGLDEVRQDPAIGPVVVPRNPEGVGPEGGGRRQSYPDGHQTEHHQGVDGRPPPPAQDVSRSCRTAADEVFSHPPARSLGAPPGDVLDWPLGDEGAYLVRGAHRGQLSTATICPSALQPIETPLGTVGDAVGLQTVRRGASPKARGGPPQL